MTIDDMPQDIQTLSDQMGLALERITQLENAMALIAPPDGDIAAQRADVVPIAIAKGDH